MVARVGSELVPHDGPGIGIDQRRMLPGVKLALVRNLTDVDRVRQQVVEVPAREGFAAALYAARRCATLCSKPEAIGLLLDPANAAEVTIKGKDAAQGLG